MNQILSLRRLSLFQWKTIVQNSLYFVVFVAFLLTTLYDIITLPLYLLWHKPWRRWPLIFRDRSVPDPNYPGQLVRKSIKTLPEDYFLNYCETVDEAFDKAYLIYGPRRKCLAYRKILAKEPSKEAPFIKYKLGNYEWITWKEMMESMAQFGSGLRQLTGAGKGDRVIIYGETSHKWFISGQAIIRNGSILTTLYSTLGNQGVLEAIKETEVKTIITTKALLTKLMAHAQNVETLTQLQYIILLDVDDGQDDQREFNDLRQQLHNNNPNDIQLYFYKQVLEAGDKYYYLNNPTKNNADDLALIMYTSGSGGRPKGVLMTHRNLLQGFRGHVSLIEYFLPVVDQHLYIGYLPLAHILEFGTETMVVLIGARCGYSSPHTLTDFSAGLMPGTKGDVTLLKPTVMAAVPLVLDKIRKAILTRLNQKGLWAVKMFEFMVEYKTFWMSKGFETPLLDRMFLNKLNKLIGGRLYAMWVGGAPLASDTQKWIRACLNVIFVQGYGSTETVGSGLFMDEHDFTLAKVGGPLYGTKVKLVDWLEGGYTTTDHPNPRGEIHVSSGAISVGYFKLKHLDHEAYYEENGERWFRTGDIVEMFPNGTFKIIDRKKDFIKLQFGEYVSLGKIETKLKTSYLVNQICVLGNPYHKYLIAIVVPNLKAFQQIKIPLATNNSDDEQKKQKQLIFTKKMTRHARRNGLRGFEIPRHYLLAINDEWTPENGLVTASFKLKRKQIELFYKEAIEKLFENEIDHV